MVTSPAMLWHYFFEIRRRRPSKVKFVYRAIISMSFNFRLVMIGSTKQIFSPHIEFVIPGTSKANEPGIQRRSIVFLDSGSARRARPGMTR